MSSAHAVEMELYRGSKSGTGVRVGCMVTVLKLSYDSQKNDPQNKRRIFLGDAR